MYTTVSSYTEWFYANVFILLSHAHFHTSLPRFWQLLPKVTVFLILPNLFKLCVSNSVTQKPFNQIY